MVVLDGVSPSPRKEGVELWPGARLIEWGQAFGDRRRESTLGIPDAVLTQTNHADTNTFRFGGSTLLCIDRTGGPILTVNPQAHCTVMVSDSGILGMEHRHDVDIRCSVSIRLFSSPIARPVRYCP